MDNNSALGYAPDRCGWKHHQVVIRILRICTFRRIEYLIALLFVAVFAIPSETHGQCSGIPSVTSLGSNKFPSGLCAPVLTNVTYSVAFASTVQAGTLELVYDWGDGTAPEVIPLTAGLKSYNTSRTHTYPVESDCEYFVTMSLRYQGKVCTNTYQVQKISSWRTDQFNGGEVKLVSPSTKTQEHLVCEGQNIDVVFEDKTSWNCNSRYINAGQDPIESPNVEYRWQQIVYNTAVSGNKIPNVSVGGILMTGGNGSDMIASYQDPRGVHFLPAPVLVDDGRRRPALRITAPGGFGAGLPRAGDVFAVTLRYWNFCNPYDDPEIPGPPADALNGDYPPVEKNAVIRILAPPPALVGNDEAVCSGTTPTAFAVTGVVSGNVVNWYRYVPGSEVPGNLIASGKSASLALTSHPDWKGPNTPSVLKVWAAQRANASGAANCESPKVLVTRTVRERLTIPEALSPIPTEKCNGETFTVTLPAPATETAGGVTRYVWTSSSGLKITSSDASSATFETNVQDFGAQLYADHTFTIARQYTTGPSCSASRTHSVRVYRTPAGGRLSGNSQVCENNEIGNITLGDYYGGISGWEIRKGDGVYAPYTGEAAGNSVSPGILAAGTWFFRARIRNGPCKEVYSNEQKVEVSSAPGLARAGEDQYICSALSSAALTANFPDRGNGLWTYVSSVPAGLPPPSFAPGDPNTTVVISPENAGVYTLRWTITHGACTSFDDVIIDFGTNRTDPDAGQDSSVCGASVSLAANVPDKGQGSWTIVRGPGGCVGEACPVSVATPTSPTSTVELKGSAFAYGAYTFRWSISSGGNNCFLKSDEVTITFDEPVSIYASDISNVCMDGSNPAPLALEGIVEGPVTAVEWINVTGKGTVPSTSSSPRAGSLAVSSFYMPSSEDYVLGTPVTLKLRATSARASCDVTEKTIRISFERKPLADAGADIDNVCGNSVALNAADPLYGAGRWSATRSGITFDDPADPKTTVRNLPYGTTTVTWTVTSPQGTCPAQSSSAALTRATPPPAEDLSVMECETQSSTTNIILSSYEDSLTTLAAADREISWFKMEGSSAIPVADPSVTQTNVADGQIYVARVRELRTGCTSDSRVTVGVRPKPLATNAVISRCEEVAGSNMVSDIDLGHSDFVRAITSESQVNVTWFSSESDAIADRFPIEEPVFVNGQKEFFGKVTYTDAPFCASISRLHIVVNPQPGVTTIVGRESVCQSVSSSFSNDLPVYVYQVMPIPGAKYYWEIPDNPDTAFKVFGGGNERDFYVLLQFPNVYTGKIKVRAEINGCSSPTIEKQIAVSGSPSEPLIDGPSVVCEDTPHVSFRVLPDNSPSSAYNWEIRKVSDNTVGGATIMEGQLTGNILVNFATEDVIISVRENNAECVSAVASKVIKVLDPPKADITIEKEITCFMAGDGVIKTEVSGGTAPFSRFEIIQTGQKDPENDGVFENLPPGSYSVRMMDSNGCFATSPMKVLDQPARIVVEAIKVPSDELGYNVSCPAAKDAAVTVVFSGGAAGDHTITMQKYGDRSAAATLVGTDSVTFAGLGQGMYAITVTDINGCTSLPSTALVAGPSELYGGAIGADQVIYSGEDPAPITEMAQAEGGTGYYEYEWQESATGNVYKDAEWQTIAGATGVYYDPPVLSFNGKTSGRRYYRRIVRSISRFTGQPQVCEEKGRTEKVTIIVNPKPVALPELRAKFTATPFASCFPVTITVNNTTTGADTFLWRLFRSGEVVMTSNLQYPQFRIAEPGVYDIHLTASSQAGDQKDEQRLTGLRVFDIPHASFEVRSNRIYVPDTPMEVMNFSTGATHYEWHFGDGATSHAFDAPHVYDNEGRYSVVLLAAHDHGMVDIDGDAIADRPLVCYDTARREVVALAGGELQIPNAFTPDTGGPNGGHSRSGGFNDVFLPAVKGATQFHMQVYDRWGTLVFESYDSGIGWDGYDRNDALMPAGVYIYKITVVQSNGEKLTRAGDVSLIR